MASKKKKPVSLALIFLSFLVLIVTFLGMIVLQERINPLKKRVDQSSSDTPKSAVRAATDLGASSRPPQVNPADWNLILVNRDHTKEEMNPALTEVAGIQVDSRIAEATTSFLTAAQAVNPGVRLISGYRSWEEQKTLYETYVQQEMSARGIDQPAAEAVVQEYFQPGGMSEHMTGLAIDMSTMASPNQMDPETAEKLAEIAPDYGFVLRFKEAYEDQTGVGPEDWHFRYVGNESARYMTDHDISLEAYLGLLNNQSQTE